MKLSLAEPKYLKESISIISELVTEARFKVTSTGLELIAMDPANVAMVVFKLFSSCFVEYDVKGETEVSINLSNFKQILRRANPSDMLSIEIGEENALKIVLKGTSKRVFSLPIIELEEKEQKVPALNFEVSITTGSSLLASAIDDVDVVGESVTFMAEQQTFTVIAEGDLNKVRIEIKADDNTKILTESKDPIKARYSIEYLKKMMGAGKLASKVKVQFSNKYPLKIEYSEVDKVMMSFILAPRVENE